MSRKLAIETIKGSNPCGHMARGISKSSLLQLEAPTQLGNGIWVVKLGTWRS